ncbi:MAG: fibronectin type III domain-containing protein [Candidatus Diapherotrites archaeon]
MTMAFILRKNEAALLFISMLLAAAGLMLALQDSRTLGFFSIFLTGDSVTRSFSSTNLVAGSTLTVYLNVDIGTAGYYALEDHLPSGWTVVPGSTNMYTDQAGVVKWLVYQNPVDTTLSYQTVVPAGASGDYSFSGTCLFEGSGETTILGQSSVNVGGMDSTPPVISNVSAVVSDSGTGATVSWSTDEDSNSKADYGLSTAYGQQVSSPVMVPAHSLPIGSLQPGTADKAYHYKVTSADASGNSATSPDYTFTIPALCADGPISGTCICGGSTKSSGYCCSGFWQANDCTSPPEPCAEGEITGGTCVCGQITAGNGYCCSGAWQDGACGGENGGGGGGGGGGGSSIYYAADKDRDGVGDCPGSIDKNQAEKSTATVQQEIAESVKLKRNLPYFKYLTRGKVTTVYYTAGIDCDCNPMQRFIGICRNNTACRGGKCVVAEAGSPGGDLIEGLGGDADKTSIFSKSFETVAAAEGIRAVLGEAGYGSAEIRYAEAVAGRLKFTRKIEVFKIAGIDGNVSHSSLITISAKNEVGTNLTNIVVLEKAPKSIAQNISEIYSDFAFNTYVNDPVIEFPLGDMNAGGESAVSYSVRRDITGTYSDFMAPVALSLDETEPPACECNDNNPCTTDGCNADGSCTHPDVRDGIKCGEGGSCMKGACTKEEGGFGSAGLLAIGLAILMLVLLVGGIVLRHGKGGAETEIPKAAPVRTPSVRDAEKQAHAKKAGENDPWKTKANPGGAEIIEEDA